MDTSELHDKKTSKLAKAKLPIRIAQIILTVIVLGLVAYVLSWLGSVYAPGTYGLNVFTCVISLLACGYSIGFPRYAATARFHHLFVEAGLEVFLVIFWFSSWVSMAALVGRVYLYKRDAMPEPEPKSHSSSSSSSSSINLPNIPGYTQANTALSVSKAAAALGALLFVLSCIMTFYLVVLAIRAWKNRSSSDAERAVPAAAMGEAAAVPAGQEYKAADAHPQYYNVPTPQPAGTPAPYDGQQQWAGQEGQAYGQQAYYNDPSQQQYQPQTVQHPVEGHVQPQH